MQNKLTLLAPLQHARMLDVGLRLPAVDPGEGGKWRAFTYAEEHTNFIVNAQFQWLSPTITFFS